MLEMTEVSKIYRTDSIETRALSEITLRVQAGEFVAIMGPSGCGKTTFLNVAGLLDTFDKGRYLLDGVDVSRLGDSGMSRIRNQKIGFIFQSFNLLPRMSALENVMLPFLYSDQPKTRSKEKGLALLKAVGLEDRVMHKPSELSGGQKQRVAIARALINDPAIILADEPTGNVDSHSGLEIMVLLQKLNGNSMTILMVTHDQYIAQHSHRIVHLTDGRITREEKVEERKNAADELQRRFPQGKEE